MRSSPHHGDGGGGGSGGAEGMNQAEGADGGGGEEGVGWWRWWRRRSAMECSIDCVMACCRRKPHWPTVLPVLGLGWLVATFLTGYGMYMVICHAPTHHLHVFTPRGYPTMKPVIIDRPSDISKCGGSWTVAQGQATLILGCFLNGFVLALMLFNMFLDRRLQHPIQIQEPPPDYESLIKEETPPPSYSELYSSSSSSSSSSGVLFVSSSPTPSNHPLIIV